MILPEKITMTNLNAVDENVKKIQDGRTRN